MIDIFDIIALALFGVLLVVFLQVLVTLGSLPGQVAQKRAHPQATAVNIASWVGIATLALGAVVPSADASSFILMGILWPFALVWAFLKPVAAGPPAGPQSGGHQRPDGKEAAA